MKHRNRSTLGIVVSAVLVLGLGMQAQLAAGQCAQPQGQGAAKKLAKSLRSKWGVKNVIIMISDGCGYNHIKATNLYRYGKPDRKQVYERFPVRLAMSTYSAGSWHWDEEEEEWEFNPSGGYNTTLAWSDFDYVKRHATDSASAATAMSTALKTYDGAIGVDDLDVPPDQPGHRSLKHVFEFAEEKGKATGVVTSVEWSHATPAGFVAHNASRNNYAAIANDMLFSSKVDVIMGCGHPWYDRSGVEKGLPNTYKYVGGQTTWDALVAGPVPTTVDADHNGVLDDPWHLIQTRAQFQSLMTGPTPKRVVGTAQVYQTLQQGRGGDGYADPYAVPLIQTVPTLAEMTRAAINVLDDDPDGFCLMVEGGAVDWASHANQTGRMIEEEEDFNAAVDAVVGWVEGNSSWGETLLIVTGDHECGYLTRARSFPADTPWADQPLGNRGPGQVPDVEWNSGSHTNALIPLYAKGRGAHLFMLRVSDIDLVRGVYVDNTAIAEVIFWLLMM